MFKDHFVTENEKKKALEVIHAIRRYVALSPDLPAP